MRYNSQNIRQKSVTAIVLILMLFGVENMFAQTNSNVNNQALPHAVFFQLIDSTDKLVINHQTEFMHIDVPKKFYNQFTAYIKDSSVAEVSGLKSLVYYNYILKNGKIVNGDIFWNDTKSYVVFTVDGKKYVNFFTKEGVSQLKTLFKL